jgi:hypothetical protein
MAIPPLAEIKIAEDVLVRELDGEGVLLNLKSGHYFGLDETGMRFWQALTTATSVQEACATLLLEYDVGPEQLAGDVESFIKTLAAAELVQVEAPQLA